MPVARLDDEEDYKMKFVDEDGDGFDDSLQGPDAIPQPLAEGQLSNRPEEPSIFEKVQPYEDVPNPTTLPGAMDANTQEVEALAKRGMDEAKPLEERANRLDTSERDLENNANLNLLTSIGNDVSIGLDGATQFKDRKMDNSAARQANTAFMDTRTAQQKAQQAVADKLRTRADSAKSQYLKERNDKNALTNTLNTSSKDRFNAPVDFQNKLDEITAKKGASAAQAALSDPKSEVSVTLRKFAEDTYGINLPTTMSAARLKDVIGFLDKKDGRDKEAQTRADKLAEDKRRHAVDTQTRIDLAADRNRNFDLNKKGLEESKAVRLGAEAERAQVKRTDRIDKDTNNYADDLGSSNVIQATSALKLIDKTLDDPKFKENLPGYGTVKGMLHNKLISEEGRKFRQAVNHMFNIELKSRSGSAVTMQELKRLQDEFGSGSWSNDEDLKNGINQYRHFLKQTTNNVIGGTTPEAKANYESRYPGGKLDITTDEDEGTTKEEKKRGGGAVIPKGTLLPPIK